MTTLLFLRHGKTNYTEQFPDLTEDGKREIAEAADHIASIVGERTDVKIISSPLPRALGTADIIAKRLRQAQDIEQELAIRCMDKYNEDGANALWRSFPSTSDMNRAYEEDPRFDLGEVLERRSSIQNRFFSYLGLLLELFASGKLSDVTIHTSHYEVLWKLAGTFGFEESLGHGEVIRLELSEGGQGTIHVQAAFRECNREFLCKLPSQFLFEQFVSRN